MKKTTLFVLALLAALFTAAPVQAATFPVTQSTALYVTTNTDVDVQAELLGASIPSNCLTLEVLNTGGSSNTLFVALVDNWSTMTTTAKNSLRYWGWPVYPALTSGATTVEIELEDQKGNRYFVDGRKVIVASDGYNGTAAGRCVRSR